MSEHLLERREILTAHGVDGYYAVSRIGPFKTEAEADAAAWYLTGEIEMAEMHGKPTLLG